MTIAKLEQVIAARQENLNSEIDATAQRLADAKRWGAEHLAHHLAVHAVKIAEQYTEIGFLRARLEEMKLAEYKSGGGAVLPDCDDAEEGEAPRFAENELSKIGFNEWRTGGNCRAFGKAFNELPGEPYILVTGDDAHLPTEGGPNIVGVYRDDPEFPEDVCFEVNTLAEILAAVQKAEEIARGERAPTDRS